MAYCDRCGDYVKWGTAENGKYRLYGEDGEFHSCEYKLILEKEVFKSMMDSCADEDKWMVRKLLERLIAHKAKYKSFQPLRVVEKFITEKNVKKKKLMCYCEESMWKSRIFGDSGSPSFRVDDDGVIY